MHNRPDKQHGSAMIEFTVVGPIIMLLGLAMLQYSLLFFAKNQINYAGFMAARAGSMSHAGESEIREAYAKALIPLYGGGQNSAELATAYGKAGTDVAGHARIELLNPTRESFDDWNDPYLQNTVGNGKRVIPNGGQAYKNPDTIGAASGQSIQDANLLKLRITHGYEPKIPVIRTIYTRYLQWLDTGEDAYYSQQVNAGRIPIVGHVTVQMQSDAIEPGNPVSIPGPGNNGSPTDPGEPPAVTTPPPDCLTIGCTVGNTPAPICDP
ncbi:MAG: pilus assembly protein, partial [Sulfurimicrobium sp.]|nr:pilus assembly protein [Sulfurimicrobium sp.]